MSGSHICCRSGLRTPALLYWHYTPEKPFPIGPQSSHLFFSTRWNVYFILFFYLGQWWWWFVSLVGKKSRPYYSSPLGLYNHALERSAKEVFSATAYKAQRLWDRSACSATAALITAETLTVCHVSMLGPHLRSCYLQYPEISDIFLPGQRRECVYICVQMGSGGAMVGRGN